MSWVWRLFAEQAGATAIHRGDLEGVETRTLETFDPHSIFGTVVDLGAVHKEEIVADEIPIVLGDPPVDREVRGGGVDHPQPCDHFRRGFACDQRDMTLLHRAVLTNNLVSTQFLIDNGANFRAVDHKGQTVMHISVHCGSDHMEVLKYLCERTDYECFDAKVWKLSHPNPKRSRP